VRDNYDLGEELLLVATDRISAFDVVLPCGIPDKGEVLTRLSAFWFELTASLVPNHFLELVEDVRLLNAYLRDRVCFVYPSYLSGRSMLVRKAQRIPVECVVRGYLSGSAWVEYQQSGTVGGIPMPSGMKECQQLPQPLFTPTTKAEGEHDRPLSREQLRALVGEEVARELEEKSLAIYRFAEGFARTRGIIIADTKMEFGFIAGQLTLIDELLTPDSSRFWDVERYEVGHPQDSFDKQPVRDWLEASGWNKQPPAPPLPPEVIDATARRYREAYRRLTGKELRNVSG
jgi:phosphoribosylaminoimidazole-succinocarboxamide synthase